MTEDYCKLVSGIILSTIWREDNETRILWITMLAVKGRDHRVLASVPGLAAVANIPIESCRSGLEKLMSPDPDSRTKDHEGRRIAPVDGGWLVLNGEKYRNFLSKSERNEYQRNLMAERRAAEKLAVVSSCDKKLAQLGQAEAEAEAEADKDIKTGRFAPPTLEAVKLYCAKAGISEQDATWFWFKMESQDWMNGKKKVKKYGMTLMAWKNAGYLPSQKQGTQQGQPSQQDWKKMSEKEIIRHVIG